VRGRRGTRSQPVEEERAETDAASVASSQSLGEQFPQNSYGYARATSRLRKRPTVRPAPTGPVNAKGQKKGFCKKDKISNINAKARWLKWTKTKKRGGDQA
jgi:hypothetical protein